MNQEGTVLWGINNIYQVEGDDASLRQCRIKGKILKDVEEDQSPITPADRVVFDPRGELIIARLPRTNSFRRYHLKRRTNQTVFANVDQVLCIVSAGEPPLKPGFIDRVILCAGDIPVVIVCNKTDLPGSDEALEQLKLYEALGFPVTGVSVFSRNGLDGLKEMITGKRSACFGQSGVGKSTIINELIPEANQRTGEVSRRYSKGRHTTTCSALFRSGDVSFELLDTPGVREVEIPDLIPHEISRYYPEMAQFDGHCRFSPCLHLHEPDCAVKSALSRGAIDFSRYERYRTITAHQMERSERR